MQEILQKQGMIGGKQMRFRCRKTPKILSIEIKSCASSPNLISLGTINAGYSTRVFNVSNISPTYDGYGDFTVGGARAKTKNFEISEIEVRQLNSSNRVYGWSEQQIQDQYYKSSGTIVYIPLNSVNNGAGIYAFDQLLSLCWFFLDGASQYNVGIFIPNVCCDVILSQGGQNFQIGYNYARFNYVGKYFYIDITNTTTSISYPNGMGCHISATYLET